MKSRTNTGTIEPQLKRSGRCANSPGPGQHPVEVLTMTKRTCSVDGCERVHYGRGLCHMHYQREWAREQAAARKAAGLPTLYNYPEARRRAAERRRGIPRTFPRTPSTKIAKAAVDKVARALKAGRLIRGTACEFCVAQDVALEAAHWDYGKPLDVKWLCRPCHRRWDRAEPKGGTWKPGPTR